MRMNARMRLPARFRIVTGTGLLAVGAALALMGCPETPQVQVTPPPKPSGVATGQACVPELTPTSPELPWKNAEELCSQASRGKPWPGALPPAGPDWQKNGSEYALRVQHFLRKLEYRSDPYNWLHDANWRLTGPYEGCPCPETGGQNCSGVNKGPHPGVRIYYSPEVIEWMCQYRKGENELPNAKPMPDGAMIIKEMLNPDAMRLARVPGTDQLWVAPPEGSMQPYDTSFSAWTILIKGKDGAADGWYAAYFDKTSSFNPPIRDRAAFTAAVYPGSDGRPVNTPPDCQWFPTYWGYSVNDVPFPNYEFGNYCSYCHASAQGESTFASFTNLLGQEIRYPWTPQMLPKGAPLPPDFDEHARAQAAPTSTCPSNPFPLPRDMDNPLPGYQQRFPELNPTYNEVWETRLPSRTWDHAVSHLGNASVAPASSQYLTSDQCEGCHEAGGSGQLAVPYMVEEGPRGQTDLSPFAEWGASPMGLAGRDPIFHAQLELERNIARDEAGLSKIMDCIDNTCLHCHGSPGARQYNIDTKGQGPAGDPCAAFLPPPSERAATDYDGKLFTHRMVMAYPEENPELSKYGGLARDGINCTICHHIADKDLDQKNLQKTFTGNFRVGPPDKLFGPFPNDTSKEDILPKPMQHALGITPEKGVQTQGSELCGTCHTVFLPVFSDQGKLSGTSYEQTTYLEWLLSDFSWLGSGKNKNTSCQSCHMPHTYRGKEITTGIANIQNTMYPEADFLLPAKDVDNPKRPYNRHSLYGLNVFLNAFVQQFPLLVGYRQQDYMNPNVVSPLLSGLDTVLEVARVETAEARLQSLSWNGEDLEAKVLVQNLSGHSLPSGVGFRRLMVEVLVLDGQDKLLWASGRTNAVGMLLEGAGNTVLKTELGEAGPDGLPFQPHYQVISAQNQAQVYEELTQNASLDFTSSFLHRYWVIKDNRLRPAGYTPLKMDDAGLRTEYGDATAPGHGPEQHWWPPPKRRETYKNKQFPAIDKYTDTKPDADYDVKAAGAKGLLGSDAIVYRIRLGAEGMKAAKKVQVKLYSQSIPPDYLKERFVEAAKPGAEKQAAVRLYYMAGHLNTDAKAADGSVYLAGYRLQVGKTAEAAVPPK